MVPPATELPRAVNEGIPDALPSAMTLVYLEIEAASVGEGGVLRLPAADAAAAGEDFLSVFFLTNFLTTRTFFLTVLPVLGHLE